MSDGVIRWLSGPVVRVHSDHPLQINEAVLVGERRLLGEIIQIREDDVVVQVYEDTTGLVPGAPIFRTGSPLAVPLGPGLLGHIFDGLLRPLSADQELIEPGLQRARQGRFAFEPTVAEGDDLEAGHPFGEVPLPGGGHYRCDAPPNVSGSVRWIAEAGEYAEDETVARLQRPDGSLAELSMLSHWPVRVPRPVAELLPPEEPLVTGQRILDMLFPVARGGRACLPGGFGTGKTVLLETLAKHSDADVVVYVGCGERGNEMAGVLHELPRLPDPRTGRPLMERTVIVANTSNMPVAGREASIYTGITVAEHFRDQGLHVALMADSTSRWAEAVREVSGRLGELPAEGGYPAYFGSRTAEFYERAGRARTLGGNVGSVTVIGAVSPPGGDFSEPVTKHTQRYVRCFWSLDAARARARLYPAVDPLESYSDDVTALASWWEAELEPRWRDHRNRMLALFEEQTRLERMARIIGKDALPPRQRLTLLCASIATDGFLRQSALSPTDASCSPGRQAAMLRLLIRFFELAEQAVEAGASAEQVEDLPVLRRLRRMGEETTNDRLDAFAELEREVEHALVGLEGRGDDAR